MTLPRWTALVTIAAWILYAWQKSQIGEFSGMLWGCHMATLVVSAGVLLRSIPLTAAGFVFYAAIGIPAYLIHIAVVGTNLASIFIHASTVIIGGLAVYRAPWSRATPWIAWAAYQGLVAVCYFFTDPALNINLAHAPFTGLERLPLWMSLVGSGMLSASFILVGDALLRRYLGPR